MHVCLSDFGIFAVLRMRGTTRVEIREISLDKPKVLQDNQPMGRVSSLGDVKKRVFIIYILNEIMPRQARARTQPDRGGATICPLPQLSLVSAGVFPPERMCCL